MRSEADGWPTDQEDTKPQGPDHKETSHPLRLNVLLKPEQGSQLWLVCEEFNLGMHRLRRHFLKSSNTLQTKSLHTVAFILLN